MLVTGENQYATSNDLASFQFLSHMHTLFLWPFFVGGGSDGLIILIGFVTV